MIFLKKHWWKGLTILLLFYVLIGGFAFEVPRLAILNETIRALYFHVPMWFGMIILLGLSCLYAIRYLASAKKQYDHLSVAFAGTGIWMGILGIFTGMLWANFTWGAPWSGDPKQNAAAIGLMIYFAYMILRNALQDPQQKARISAVYNIFAFAALVPILFVLPRLTDSLHPGNGGNPGFNAYDLDSKLRLVFYPAVIGWTLLGVWLTHLKLRLYNIEDKFLNVN